MASTPPPSPSQRPAPVNSMPVPTGGNGKFILLALLLLGIVGAMFGVRTCQKPPEPLVIVTDASPPPGPTKNLDDDIPPPPPIEEAGVDAGKRTTAAISTASVLASLCDAKQCTGGSTPDIETALAFRAKQSHRCYDHALAQDPTLRGKISISVRIGANGVACSAGVVSNELGSAPAVASCVVNNFRGQVFPPPRGGCVDVNIPINFVPRQ